MYLILLMQRAKEKQAPKQDDRGSLTSFWRSKRRLESKFLQQHYLSRHAAALFMFQIQMEHCRLNDHFLTDIKTAFYQTKKQNTNTTRDSKLFISTVKFLGPLNTRDFSSTVVRRNGVVSYNYTL